MVNQAREDVLRRLPKSLSNTLSLREKRQSFLLLLFILLNSFVELVGLATIVPVVSAVADPAGEEVYWIGQIRAILEEVTGTLDDASFIHWLVGLMVSAFAVKALFGMGVIWFQNRMAYAVAYRLKGMLWTWHFTRSLERMRSKDSGKLMSEITFWPAQYVKGTLLAVIGLLTDVLVLLLIVTGLLVYD